MKAERLKSFKKIFADPRISLASNLLFALAHSALGFFTRSWWFITLGAYYAVLATTRFSVLQVTRRSRKNKEIEKLATRITDILFVFLSICILGIMILASVKDRGKRYHEIVMIAMAVYAFSKVTLAIIGLVKTIRTSSHSLVALRNISLATALASIYSLQRSMLVSFGEMAQGDIQLFNILTGSGVCILTLLLGINLIGGRKVEMAKSKIAKANERIADTVVGGYKSIEKGVVNTYCNIEDKFVEKYLAKDGETVEEAKRRIKNKIN